MGGLNNPSNENGSSGHARKPYSYRESKCHDILKTIAGVGGNVLEWLDFAVFGFFSDIIGMVFFPKDQPEDLSTLESFAVFGGAFLMRPIGGIIIGYIGDRVGRKFALELSVFLMAIATFIMGSLPTYDQVGAWAILLLLIVRLCQGLSVGGQLMSSLVFTLEGHPAESWGLYGSFVLAAANLGTFLGGIVAWILQDRLTQDELIRWGWRLPFWVGSILVGLCGLYLKYFCPEDDDHFHAHGAIPTTHSDDNQEHTPAADASSEDDPDTNSPAIRNGGGATGIFRDPAIHADHFEKKNPLRVAFSKQNMPSLLASSMVPMLWSGGFYLTFVWLAIYMKDLIDHPVPSPFGVNSASLLLLMLWFPIAGWLSDKFSRKSVMTAGGTVLGVTGPILIFVIGTHPENSVAFASQVVMGISVSLWGAPMCAWLVESFEPAARLTSVSVGYNVAQAIAGGLSPFLATVLVEEVSPLSPGLLFLGLALVGLIGLLFVAPEHVLEHTPLENREEEEHDPDELEDPEEMFSLELPEIS